MCLYSQRTKVGNEEIGISFKYILFFPFVINGETVGSVGQLIYLHITVGSEWKFTIHRYALGCHKGFTKFRPICPHSLERIAVGYIAAIHFQLKFVDIHSFVSKYHFAR